MAETGRFQYTNDQWQAIVSELADPWPGLRNFLELAANDYIAQVRAADGKPGRSYLREARKWREIANTAKRLQTEIDEIGEHPLAMIYGVPRGDKVEAQRFLSYLPRFADLADRMANRLDGWHRRMPRQSNASDSARDQFLDVLFFEWQQEGGELKTSLDGGPLLRFLQVASRPAFEAAGKSMPTANALRHHVRNARNVPNRNTD